MSTSVAELPKNTAEKAATVLMAIPLAGALEIPLDQLVPSKTNRRTVRHAEADAELVESVKMRGVQEPIICRKFPGHEKDYGGVKSHTISKEELDKYEIVCGHRRYEASIKAGKTTIPAIVKKLSNAEALEIQNIENLQREDLDPLDRAEAIHDLYQQYLKGMTPKEAIAKISGRLNCKERTLYNMMSLRNLLPAVQKAIAAGEISMSQGYLVAALSPDPQKEVWAWVQEQHKYGDAVSVRELQQFINDEIFRRLSSASWDLDDAKLLPAAGACSACPKNSAVNPNVAPGEKKATCTDPSCFEQKENAHLVQLQELVKKETGSGKVLQIAGAHVGYKETLPKGVVARDDWRESKEGSCPSTVPAVVATTNATGQTRYVCTDKGCKKHWSGKKDGFLGSSASASDYGLRNKVMTESEKKARLQKVRGKKLDEAYRIAATAAVRKQVTELKTADLQDLAKELLERTDRRLRVPICRAMGWKVSERAYYEISRQQIIDLKPADLASLIALTALADNVLPGLDYYGQHSKVEMAAFAKRHKIDLAKIKDQAEAPLKAKFKAIDARKAKAASTTSTKSTKAKSKKAAARKAA